MFIKRLGVYPPGTAVLLDNNEVAVIIARNLQDSTRPQAVSIGVHNGAFFPEPKARDMAASKRRIKEVYEHSGDARSHPAQRVRKWV